MVIYSFEFWNKEKLWDLRSEIVLGSIFYNDYKNKFDIPEVVCANFFDGFLDYCFELEEEKGNTSVALDGVYKEYDNKDDLWNYFCCYEFPFGYTDEEKN